MMNRSQTVAVLGLVLLLIGGLGSFSVRSRVQAVRIHSPARLPLGEDPAGQLLHSLRQLSIKGARAKLKNGAFAVEVAGRRVDARIPKATEATINVELL